MSFLHSTASEQSTVRVAVRVRPLNQREDGTKSVIDIKGSTVYLRDPETNKKKSFIYDHAYPSESQQEDLYEDIGTYLIDNAFKGYNTCVFAYGQSGSGKTHSVMGTNEQPGLIPRVCHNLFELQSTHNGADVKQATVTYKLEVSYLEIYSENVRDLLSHTPGTTLRVREHPELGPYVEGLSQILVEDFISIKQLIEQGNKERVTASTLLNQRSSRSHAILTLHFTQLIDDPSLGTPSLGKTREVVSKINLVDLAGSEKVEISGVTGINFTEAININRSLSSLGLVISKLAKQSHDLPVRVKPKATIGKVLKASKNQQKATNKYITEHVPYRDAVLTWILRESLGGNSKTFMLATVSPSELNYDETMSSLRYASNAKQIINKVKVNEDPNDKLIRVLKNEIEELKRNLITRGSDSTSSAEDLRALRDEIAQREDLMREKDKSWEQKLAESKQISEQAQEQIRKEFEAKLELMHVEQDKLLKEMASVRSGMTDTFEEKLTKKQKELDSRQAEFEKERIVGAAVSLQEYYEKKLEKLRDEYEEKMRDREQLENEKALKDINDLKEVNIKLKEDLNRNQRDLQQQIRQFTSERVILSKQIQQLHTKIHNMEADIAKNPNEVTEEYIKITALREEEEKKYQTLQSEYTLLNGRIDENKQQLTELETKHAELITEVDISRTELKTLKTEYAQLAEKFTADKLEYDALITKKEILHTEIVSLKAELDMHVEIAKEKLKNPTIDDLLRIKDGLSKIFESLGKQ